MPCQAWRPVGVSPSVCLRYTGPVQEQSVRLVFCLVSIPPPLLVTFPSKDEWQGITMCPACDTVGYCGPRCREAARPRHQVECSLLVLRGRKTWPHRAWFLARACLRLDAEGWDERDRINSTKSRAFRDLLDRKFSTLHVRLEHLLCRLQ